MSSGHPPPAMSPRPPPLSRAPAHTVGLAPSTALHQLSNLSKSALSPPRASASLSLGHSLYLPGRCRGFQKHRKHPADSKEEDRGTGSQVPQGPRSPDVPTETLGVTGPAALGLIAGPPRRAREGSVGAGASESPVAMGSSRGPGRPTTGLPQVGRQGPPWTCSTQPCGPGAQGLGDAAHSTTSSLLSPYPRRWGGCRLRSDQRSRGNLHPHLPCIPRRKGLRAPEAGAHTPDWTSSLLPGQPPTRTT